MFVIWEIKQKGKYNTNSMHDGYSIPKIFSQRAGQVVERNYTIFFFSLQFSFILLRLGRPASTTTTTTTTKHVVRACSTARPRGSLLRLHIYNNNNQERAACGLSLEISLLRAETVATILHLFRFILRGMCY